MGDDDEKASLQHHHFKIIDVRFVGGLALLPTQASAQFNIPIPIPIPHFDLRPPPSYHSAPSHRSSSQAKHEENNGSSTEKDATQEEPNTGPSTEHQQQASGPTRDSNPSFAKSNPPQNDADTPPPFAPFALIHSVRLPPRAQSLAHHADGVVTQTARGPGPCRSYRAA